MSLNLYDVLDVDESATEGEVRAAWRRAVADLDPTDRRFRAYSDAAAVLLDDARRASYDAELATQRADQPADQPAEAPAEAPVDEPAEAPADEPVGEPVEEPATAAAASRWGLWAAGAAAALAVLVAAWVLTLPGVRAETTPAGAAEAAEAAQDAGASAQVAAADTIVPLLGYDYRTMDEDLTRIQAHMTDAMAGRQASSWSALTEEARRQKVVVTADAPSVALTRVAADGDRATVVAFIDQHVEKKGAEPFTLQMWATLTLVRDGGEWLLDDICTEGDCS
ncbi:hypothetical protein [Nocardioides sp. YIM 152588]|uniref:J domain-containing protein n=1 Tax=Nocardioides sp. YIM 152588 TaxID=3158259 RepID=UPI0032E5182A